jgi:hypothetical protein
MFPHKTYGNSLQIENDSISHKSDTDDESLSNNDIDTGDKPFQLFVISFPPTLFKSDDEEEENVEAPHTYNVNQRGLRKL